MAYVVGRRNNRFEVRESVHTPNGPRARTLAGFQVLTGEVLQHAARRATRPFDAGAVIASGRRAGAPVAAAGAGGLEGSTRRFIETSRRMAASLGRSRAGTLPGGRGRRDPGEALIDLLGFADAVALSQPARPFERLAFPVLARLVHARGATPGHG
jgi:hypothetical protein